MELRPSDEKIVRDVLDILDRNELYDDRSIKLALQEVLKNDRDTYRVAHLWKILPDVIKERSAERQSTS